MGFNFNTVAEFFSFRSNSFNGKTYNDLYLVPAGDMESFPRKFTVDSSLVSFCQSMSRGIVYNVTLSEKAYFDKAAQCEKTFLIVTAISRAK